MTLPTSVHDLKTLVLSFHPVIAIDTVEEERVERLLDAAGADLGLPVFEWTVTRGLVGPSMAHPNRATAKPLALLQHLQGLTIEAIFLLKDLARYLEDPAVCRQFRDLARSYAKTRSTLVVTGAGHRFPKDVDHLVVHYALALPGKEELREVVTTVARSLMKRGRERVELDAGSFDALLRALSGLTLNQARQAISRPRTTPSSSAASGDSRHGWNGPGSASAPRRPRST
jgi:hypothetical protein